jgi:putative flavoprotein involved in K+ transport
LPWQPVFDGRGLPLASARRHAGGRLYFIGLPWLHTWGSGRFSAVGEDAEWLAAAIAARAS